MPQIIAHMTEIRRARPDFPVVICSGYTQDPSLVGDEQPTALLGKPWEPADLVRTVRSALAGDD